MATGRHAIVLVPPFIKYSAGPLLGPSLLQSAARSSGHRCSVIDLRMVRGKFVGDHDKPTGPLSLTLLEKQFMDIHLLSAIKRAPSFVDSNATSIEDRVKYGFLTHDEVSEAAEILAGQEFGCWVKDVTEKEIVNDPPHVIGISLLHSGQVIPSAAITKIMRQLWPQALIVWGGPHISGLGTNTLIGDLQKRSFAADAFVTGHAEETFVQVLNGAAELKSATSKSPVVLEGRSKVVSPTFDNLDLYDAPLSFPAQSSIGCAYGKCAYCTYPNIEGRPQKLDLDTSVLTVVQQAKRMSGATLSLKDSLVTTNRLLELGDCIQNRVKWSACTKLSRRLDKPRLNRLANSGLATLEVGLESLLPETQRRVNKIQPQCVYEDFLHSVADLPHDLSIVVNYMIGFPWEDSDAAQSKLGEAETLLLSILGEKRGLIELNKFELERLAPMAKLPEAYGIDPARITPWPWASVLEMENPT